MPSVLPMALPYKGQKSYSTAFFEKRYNKSVVSSTLPSGWLADSVVLVGMILINVSPLITHRTMKDYANFILLII